MGGSRRHGRWRVTDPIEHESGLPKEQFQDLPLQAGVAERHAGKVLLVDDVRLPIAPGNGWRA